MAWITLTETDVESALNHAELESYRESKAATEADPLASILSDVTYEVRAYVGNFYTLESAGIPPNCKNAALDLAVYRLLKRIATGSDEQRKPAADDARKFLERAAKGEIFVEGGADTGVPVPKIDARDRKFGRPASEGLGGTFTV